MSAGVPKKELSYIHMGKNIRSPSTEPHAEGRPTYNGVRPRSPRGSLRHCYLYPSAMQPLALYLPPWLGQTRALLASMCSGNPHQGTPSTTVTASHVTQGRTEYECTIPRGTDEELDLWKAEETEIPKVPHQENVDNFFRISRRSAQSIRTRREKQ